MKRINPVYIQIRLSPAMIILSTAMNRFSNAQNFLTDSHFTHITGFFLIPLFNSSYWFSSKELFTAHINM